ncbi:MAG TPA: GNAT family protein [Pseudonocardiaceae bacterium]
MTGGLVLLRARIESDVPVLETQLHDDVAGDARSTGVAWRPMSPGSQASMDRVTEPTDRAAPFSVLTLAEDTLAGVAVLWDISWQNRSGHVGLDLLPGFRGNGLGTDVVRVLCHYGFVVLGLHRIQIDTLTDNHAMIRVAQRVGFQHEAVHRRAAWVMGEFLDEVVLGLLAREWNP